MQGIIAGGEPAFTRSVEDVEDNPDAGRQALIAHGITAGDAVVGIAASGRTPYVLGALAYANEVGALTVGVSCNRPAAVLEAASIGIGVVTGPEVIAGSTRLSDRARSFQRAGSCAACSIRYSRSGAGQAAR